MALCICLINQVYLLPTNTSVCTHMKKNPEFFKDISYLIVDVIEISLKKKHMKGYCADIGLSFEKLVSAL